MRSVDTSERRHAPSCRLSRTHEARFLSCPVTRQETVSSLGPRPPSGGGLFIQKGSLQAGLRALHGSAVNS